MKVVVIDNFPVMRRALAGYLRAIGYVVNDPVDGQSFDSSVYVGADLILCDTRLGPLGRGPDFIQELYERGLLDPSVPIIPMTTGYEEDPNWKKIGATDGKLYSKDEFEELISAIEEIQSKLNC